MRITNLAGLPEPLVRAVTLDPYEVKSDFSTTQLIKPPRIVALEREHADDLEEDAADRIWALMGQLGHMVLERAGLGDGTTLVEQRLFDTIMGKTISGQVDLWQGNNLIDYKFTSIYTARDGVKPEWEQQMNINAHLCERANIPVKRAQIICIFRDWSVGKARRNRNDYPQQQVRVLDVKLWPRAAQLKFIEGRLAAHIEAGHELPECTPLERWERQPKWAVMKKGLKRAIGLFDDRETAERAAKVGILPLPKYYVEHRPGVQVRCEDYCPVSKFCSWWQDYQKTNPR